MNIIMKNIILITLLIILCLLIIAALVAAALDTEGKTCAKILVALFLVIIITRCVANL